MKQIIFIVILLSFFGLFKSFAFAGEPVPGAEIIIEQEQQNPDGETVAFQRTGNSGIITFDHLDRGKYKILIVLPNQKMTKTKEKNKFKKDLRSTYDANKRTYFLNEREGLFAIKFNNLKKISNSNITPIYKMNRKKDNSGIVIATFQIKGEVGEITLSVESLSQKEFSSKIKKIHNDTAKNTINNIR